MASSATVSSISNTNESNTEERRRDSNDGKETGPNFTSSSANEQSCRDKPPQNNNDEASEQQLQISKPEGWIILERENPEYGRNILSSHYRCLDCRNTHIAKATNKLKPHCLCSSNNDQDENSVDACGMKKSCNWKCPAGGQLSHCPTCLCRSMVYHRPAYSSVIDLYFCACCENSYNNWSQRDDKNNWCAWEHFKCNSNTNTKGECFKRWTCKFFATSIIYKKIDNFL